MNIIKKLSFILIYFCTIPVFAETASETAEHATRKAPTIFTFLGNPTFITKYIVMIIIGVIALLLLKTKRMNNGIKTILLLISTLLFGLSGNFFNMFAMHPSPMCVTKALLYGFGIPFAVTLFVILLLSLIGPRLFCAYVCPVGAIQELINMLTKKLKIKKFKSNFTIAHIIRLFLFVTFIFLSATAIIYSVYEGTKYAKSLYDYVNAFHGLEFGLEENLIEYLIHYLPFLLTIIFAFKYYRPFCHFVCPIGLFTHWTEQVSLFKIQFNKNNCNSCNKCVKEAPCYAMKDILNSSTLRPDCFTCNVCIESCDQNALEIGIKKTNK